jgi:hypothetical protein
MLERRIQTIQLAQNGLEKITKKGKYASESNGIIFAAIASLERIKSESNELQYTLAVYLIGALTAALAFNQFKYSAYHDLTVVSIDPNNEFYNHPFYPISWNELHDEIQQEDKEDIQQEDNEVIKTERLILDIGTKVVSGALPFEPEKLIFLFPWLKEHIGAVQLVRNHKKPVYIPFEEKAIYNISLEKLKEKLSEHFKPYFENHKFHFFQFGPHHKERAKHVFAAVDAANDIETIIEILQHQDNLMQKMQGSPRLIQKFKENVGLSERWTTLDKLKNKSISVNQSGYYNILKSSLALIETYEKKEESIYTQLLSPHVRK